MALSAINHLQDVEVVFVKVTLLLRSTLDKYKCYVHMVINHVVIERHDNQPLLISTYAYYLEANNR